MKITDITSHAVELDDSRSWLFVRVATDEGLVGWGEASQTRNDEGVERDVEALRPYYLGKSPLNVIEAGQAVLRWPYVGKSLFAAVSAIEQALWDLNGKRLGVPTYQLLGGAVRDRVRAYANIGYAIRDDSPAESARVAAEAVAAGFSAVKLYAFGEKPDGGSSPAAVREWLQMGIERVRAVRYAVGADVDVMVDLMHQIDDVKLATSIAASLAPLDVFWIEDPFVHDRTDVLTGFRTAISTRLAGGAPYLDMRDFAPLVSSQSLDVLMPDIKWLGGIMALKKAAALADAFGVLVSPHNASGPIATAASVQVCATMNNFLVLEYAWGAPDWRHELCGAPEVIRDGHFILSSRPGLGMDLDETVLRTRKKRPGASLAALGIGGGIGTSAPLAAISGTQT